jgi:ABC-type Fe3+/spermidine/putrescine transport system ATPase subunit
MSPAEEVITTRRLTKRYGNDALAVADLDLSVRRGEVYGFLGLNGAGKTTALRMLLGLIRPTSGTAVVAGRRPGDPAGLARIGSLVEAPAFYPYLSGRENLRVIATYAGVPHSKVGLGLAYMLIIEGLVFGLLGGFNLSWLTTAEEFFIGQNATALGLSFGQAVQAARGGGPVVSSTPLVGAGQAVLVLAAYGLAFIAGSMLVVRRRDIT